MTTPASSVSMIPWALGSREKGWAKARGVGVNMESHHPLLPLPLPLPSLRAFPLPQVRACVIKTNTHSLMNESPTILEPTPTLLYHPTTNPFFSINRTEPNPCNFHHSYHHHRGIVVSHRRRFEYGESSSSSSCSMSSKSIASSSG